MRFSIFGLLLFFFSSTISHAQTNNEGGAILTTINYATERPGGDLAERFGQNFDVGLSVEWMTGKGNFIFGLDAGIIFGSEVKEDPLTLLRTLDGSVIGNDRNYASISLRERGFYAGGFIGKLFSLSSKNPRSGIRLTIGTGLLQHKIRIQDDPERQVAALSGAYRKGYDRLSNGLAFNEFIGYQMLSKNRRINFYAGIELMQGLTQNRRTIDFDTRVHDDLKRKDFLYGFKIGWTLPFYVKANPDEIFY